MSNLLKELEAQAAGLNFNDLEVAEQGAVILSPDDQDLKQGDLVKRAIMDKANFELGIYPPKAQFLDHLRANWNHSQNVKRSSLRVGGHFVRDTFERYLHETNVRLGNNGLETDENGKTIGFFQSSHLKAANITPRHLYFKLADNLLPKREDAGHFNLGEALHACLMEPTRFSRYVVEPQASKSSNDGCDMHIKFWRDKLLSVFIKNEGSTIDGRETYQVAIDAIIDEIGLLRSSQIIEFLLDVRIELRNELSRIQEGHFFSELLGKVNNLMIEHFGKTIQFEAKTTEDPFCIVVKELGLVKNQTLGESKKGPFDSQPKAILLANLLQVTQDYITFKGKGPEENFSNMDQKKKFIEALKTAAGLESVSEKEFTIIKCLELNAKHYGNGIIYKLAKHSHRECSAYLDDYDGLPLKVRPDMIQFSENIGVDAIISVKSSSSPNLEKFFYDTAKYQYELSEGMYCEVMSKVTGREFRSVITIMYQTVEPWGVAVFWWKPEDIELGRHKFIQAHQTLKDTLEKGLWPGYDIYSEEGDFGVIDMALPWWAYKGLEERNQEGLNHLHSSGEL